MVLVTAFVDFRKAANFWRAVGRATDRGVDVTLYARGEESVIRNAKAAGKILENPRIHAFRVENLHAKIYVNESTALLGSINLVAASFAQSIDFTVRVTREHPLFRSACDFVENEVKAFREPLLGSSNLREPMRLDEKERPPRTDGDACFRCGRSGHWEEECYATTGRDGRRLQD